MEIASHLQHFAEEASVVDRVVRSRQVYKDNTGDQAFLITIFYMLCQVE